MSVYVIGRAETRELEKFAYKVRLIEVSEVNRKVGPINRWVMLDEGPGLPAGEEGRVFETFVRLEGSDRKGGTGLGLAIVKGFVEAMGLQITARNNEDRPGACFTIRFPDRALLRAPSCWQSCSAHSSTTPPG